MKFSHRLAYFLFGLMLGCFFLYFFLSNKEAEFCYMPNCRVLKNLRSKGLVIAPEAQQKLDEKWVTLEDIKKCTEYGDVDFSRSNQPHDGGGKLYVIEGKNAKGEPIEVEMLNFEKKAVLKDIKKL